MAGVVKKERVLAMQVRDLALNQIMTYLKGDDEVFKRQLLLKLSTSILPRLNEISGPDGGDVPIPIFGGLSKQNAQDQEHNSNAEDIQPQEEN